MKKNILKFVTAILALVAVYIYLTKHFTPLRTAIFAFSTATFPILAVLLFLKDEVFNAWKKLAIWWLPLSVVVILLTSNYQSGMGLTLGIDQKLVSLWMAGLFLIISLIIIIKKSVQLRGK